jgi:hypothetical protein
MAMSRLEQSEAVSVIPPAFPPRCNRGRDSADLVVSARL